MKYEDAKELHRLFFSFSGMFHEKFIFRFGKHAEALPWLKKNHLNIINMLYQHEYLTCTEIGKKLNIEKGSLTALIDQLAEKNFVARCNDCNDRRKCYITLTAQGKQEMENIMNFHIEKMNDFFQGIDQDELYEFMDNLKYVVEFMKKL